MNPVREVSRLRFHSMMGRTGCQDDALQESLKKLAAIQAKLQEVDEEAAAEV